SVGDHPLPDVRPAAPGCNAAVSPAPPVDQRRRASESGPSAGLRGHPAALKEMPKLSIRKSSGQFAELPLLHARYSVGRSADNDIVLEGAGVSRHHCALERDGEGYQIRDLGSHKGVYLNGRAVQQARLRENDEIRIGNAILVYGPASDLTSTVTFEEDYDQVVASIRAGAQTPPGATGEELAGDRRTLSLLCDLSFGLSTVTSLDEVARKAIEILLETTRAERGAIFLLDGEPGALRPIMVCERGESRRD